MNARLFDEMIIEAQAYVDKLMQDVVKLWLGNRAPQEEQDGEEYNEETEDLYSQEE